MAVYIQQEDTDSVSIPSKIIIDKRISDDTLRFYCYLLFRSETEYEKISFDSIKKDLKISNNVIVETHIRELEECGYIEGTQNYES